MKRERLRILQAGIERPGAVIYWMQRDQRVYDNWALIHAQNEALKKEAPLVVLFNLVPNFLGATLRQYGFMLRGLSELQKELGKFNIGFKLTIGNPAEEIPKFINEQRASLLVSDFNPLKIARGWKKDVAKKIDVPFHEVDAHNIVPCLFLSDKQEFAAHTIRPKIHRLLPEFMDQFPQIKKMPTRTFFKEEIAWNKLIENLKADRSVGEVDSFLPGEKASLILLDHFIENKLEHYNDKRNDPTADASSNLSPYLHFGQISAQRVALEVSNRATGESLRSFLEELIVRRELADNFCYFNTKYDSFEGFQQWAKDSLNLHRKDKREYIYSTDQFESGATHDNLWNAAHREMVKNGKMHSYMRMYWAKKILEWSKCPEEALKTAIYLNDKYELDGRDPNGYTGIAWSIGGVHDKPWIERNIFGKIRYMSYAGCKKKFDILKYEEANS